MSVNQSVSGQLSVLVSQPGGSFVTLIPNISSSSSMAAASAQRSLAILYVHQFLDQELVWYCYSSFVVGATLFKKAPSFEIGSGWNLAVLFLRWICIEWQYPIIDMTCHFQDGDHDIISCRTVLPPGDCTQSSHHLYSSARQFLIYSTIVLVSVQVAHFWTVLKLPNCCEYGEIKVYNVNQVIPWLEFWL